MPEPVLVCASAEVAEGGPGRRFDVLVDLGKRREPATGFVVRYEGTVRAYLNQCQHVPVELDWQPGRFFDDSGLYLLCATHGAVYRPDDGLCIGGPCPGRSLRALGVEEREGNIYWIPDRFVLSPD